MKQTNGRTERSRKGANTEFRRRANIYDTDIIRVLQKEFPKFLAMLAGFYAFEEHEYLGSNTIAWIAGQETPTLPVRRGPPTELHIVGFLDFPYPVI
jgi:hypothetical protein